MLKVEPPAIHLIPQLHEKCGEIFYHNFKDFTIYCCFCNLQLFAFQDFCVHILDVHFENNTLKEQTITGAIGGEWANNRNAGNPLTVDVELKQEEISANEDEFEDTVSVRKLEHTEESEEEATESEMSYDSEADSGSNFDKDSTDRSLLKILHVKTEGTEERRKRNKFKTKNVNKSKESEGVAESPKEETTDEENSGDESETKRKEQQYNCRECSEIFARKKNMHEHVIAIHKGYKCSVCEKRYRREVQYKIHIKSHTQIKPKIPCPNIDCRRTFSSMETLNHHLELHTMAATFVCEVENCQKAYPTEQRLLTHSKTHKKHHICDICGYSCCSYATLLIHKRRHTGEKPFSCEICGKPFISKSALGEHMNVHRRTGNHICRICNATFVNDRYLYRHMVIHNSGRSTKCSLCDKVFPTMRGLNNHMRYCKRRFKVQAKEITEKKGTCTVTENTNDEHKGVQDHELNSSKDNESNTKSCHEDQQQPSDNNETLKFPCPRPDCGRTFTNEKNLKRHLEVHTMEAAFVCHIEGCGKAFPTETRLKVHTRAHNKHHVCDICGYRCVALATLVIHKRVHTGERPFSCEVCEKTFISKTALLDHMHAHATTRPHVCEICQADFTSFKALRRHNKTHTTERNYKCKLCDKAFKNYNGLDNHMRCMHREPNGKQPDILIADKFEEYALKKIDQPLSKVKKYKCQECNKTFKRLNGLDNHLRQFHGATDSSIVESLENSDKKKFKCNLCNKMFVSLVRHNLTHKDDRKFECKLCDNIFKTYNGLNSHMLRVHGDVNDAGDSKDLSNAKQCSEALS